VLFSYADTYKLTKPQEIETFKNRSGDGFTHATETWIEPNQFVFSGSSTDTIINAYGDSGTKLTFGFDAQNDQAVLRGAGVALRGAWWL